MPTHPGLHVHTQSGHQVPLYVSVPSAMYAEEQASCSQMTHSDTEMFGTNQLLSRMRKERLVPWIVDGVLCGVDGYYPS